MKGEGAVQEEQQEWVPELPIDYLPEYIKEAFRQDAELLLYELKINKLEVILIPAPTPQHSGHKIRAVQNKNPYWYSKLYHTYNHFRRDRSIRALKRIRDLHDRKFRISPYKYDEIYRSLILKRLVGGFLMQEGCEIEANRQVKEFFDKYLHSHKLEEYF
ncbi:hypothetical protein HZB88_02255 [archaeon]|nr:hypothetical protein [archaeon]